MIGQVHAPFPAPRPEYLLGPVADLQHAHGPDPLHAVGRTAFRHEFHGALQGRRLPAEEMLFQLALHLLEATGKVWIERF